MNFFSNLKERLAASGLFNTPLYLKYHQYIVPGIVLVIAILISTLVTIPQLLNLMQTFKKIDELKGKKAFYETKISTLRSIDTGQYKKNLDTALIALPTDKDIPGVTGELLTALGASGLTLDGITFSTGPGDASKISELTLKIDVSGSELSLTNLLERIKLTPRIIKITSIDVGRSKQKVTATIGLATLYQQLPEVIGAVDEAVPQITPQDNQTLAEIASKAGAIPQISQEGPTNVEGKLDPFSL